MMEFTIYYLNTKENDLSQVEEEVLSLEEKEELSHYKSETAREERIASAYLKKTLIGDAWIDKKGKPHSKKTEFNISHSKGNVVLVTSSCPIGIDIETLREIDEDLVSFVCSPEEKEFVDEPKKFFVVWTNKEAILKADGSGLRNDMKRVPGLPIDAWKEYGGARYQTKTIFYRGTVITVAIRTQKEIDLSLKVEEVRVH